MATANELIAHFPVKEEEEIPWTRQPMRVQPHLLAPQANICNVVEAEGKEEAHHKEEDVDVLKVKPARVMEVEHLLPLNPNSQACSQMF